MASPGRYAWLGIAHKDKIVTPLRGGHNPHCQKHIIQGLPGQPGADDAEAAFGGSMLDESVQLPDSKFHRSNFSVGGPRRGKRKDLNHKLREYRQVLETRTKERLGDSAYATPIPLPPRPAGAPDPTPQAVLERRREADRLPLTRGSSPQPSQRFWTGPGSDVLPPNPWRPSGASERDPAPRFLSGAPGDWASNNSKSDRTGLGSRSRRHRPPHPGSFTTLPALASGTSSSSTCPPPSSSSSPKRQQPNPPSTAPPHRRPAGWLLHSRSRDNSTERVSEAIALRRATHNRLSTAPRSPKTTSSPEKAPTTVGPPTVESIIMDEGVVDDGDAGDAGYVGEGEEEDEIALRERKEECATKIQAWHRGKQARSEVAQRRQQQQQEEEKRNTALREEAAAVKIQAIHRGRAVRRSRPPQRQEHTVSAAEAAALLVAGAATAALAVVTAAVAAEAAAAKAEQDATPDAEAAVEAKATAEATAEAEAEAQEEEEALQVAFQQGRNMNGTYYIVSILEPSQPEQDIEVIAYDIETGQELKRNFSASVLSSCGGAAELVERLTLDPAGSLCIEEARETVDEQKVEEEKAALRIQALHRGNKGRRAVAAKRKVREAAPATPSSPCPAADADAALDASEAADGGTDAQLSQNGLEERAATRIQAIHRGQSARKSGAKQRAHLEAERAAAVKIQAVHRGRAARKHLPPPKASHASKTRQNPESAAAQDDQADPDPPAAPRSPEHSSEQPIAATVEPADDHDDLAHREKEAECATKIQAWHRGKQARSAVAKKRQSRKEEEALREEAAAVKIQSIHRGRVARSRLPKKEEKREERPLESSQDVDEGPHVVYQQGRMFQGQYYIVSILQSDLSEQDIEVVAYDIETADEVRTQFGASDLEACGGHTELVERLALDHAGGLCLEEAGPAAADELKAQEEKAALRIQARHRGNRSRKAVAEKKRQRTVPHQPAKADEKQEEREADARDASFEEAHGRLEERAATRIQAVHRGQAARKSMAQQKAHKEAEQAAAVKIQAAHRGRVARKQLRASLVGTSVPEDQASQPPTHPRSPEPPSSEREQPLSPSGNDHVELAAHEEQQNEVEVHLRGKEEESATKLQAWHRGKQARAEAATKRQQRQDEQAAAAAAAAAQQEEAAAVKIQSVHRGRAARKARNAAEMEAAKRSNEAQALKEQRAATRIQAAHRGQAARKSVAQQRANQEAERAAAVRIQSVHRGRTARRNLPPAKAKDSEAAVPQGEEASAVSSPEVAAESEGGDGGRHRAASSNGNTEEQDCSTAPSPGEASNEGSASESAAVPEDAPVQVSSRASLGRKARVRVVSGIREEISNGETDSNNSPAEQQPESQLQQPPEDAPFREATRPSLPFMGADDDGKVDIPPPPPRISSDSGTSRPRPVAVRAYTQKNSVSQDLLQATTPDSVKTSPAQLMQFQQEEDGGPQPGSSSELFAVKVRAAQNIRKLAQERKVGTCKLGHILVEQPPSDDGWACDCRNESFGCCSGITDYFQTAGMKRFECRTCDFDLCPKCYLLVASHGPKFWVHSKAKSAEQMREAALLARVASRVDRRRQQESNASGSQVQSEASQVVPITPKIGRSMSKGRALALRARASASGGAGLRSASRSNSLESQRQSMS